MTLDIADYTESMKALNHILTKTPMSQSIPYVLQPLTARLLKEGLRTDWTAEQIGYLVVKYKSEEIVNEITKKINFFTKSEKERSNNFKDIYHDKKIFENI